MKLMFLEGAELRPYQADSAVWFGRLRPNCVVVPRKRDVYVWDDVDILFAVRALLLRGHGEVRNLKPARPVAFNRVEECVAYPVREPLLVRTAEDDGLASFLVVRPHPQDGLQVDKDLVDLVLSRALRRALRARQK